MAQSEFVTFQRFTEKLEADKLIAMLEKNDIETMLEDNTSSLDSSFGGGNFSAEHAVKIRQSDFEKANRLLIEEAVNDLDAIDKNYYLFTFSDEELRDIVAHPDEWNAFDFTLAQRLLKDRGQEIHQEELNTLRQQRVEELSRPEPKQTGTIFFGYIAAFLGGILGIIIGWYLSTHKRTLPNGHRVYNYSESDRVHGNRIFYLGIFFLVFWLFMHFYGLALMTGGNA